jgi:hypothetical protein
MDLYKIIQDLNAEKERIERVIASIEELQRSAGLPVPPAPDSGKRRAGRSMRPLEHRKSHAG